MDSSHVEQALMEGRQLVEQREWAAALEILEEAACLNPECPDAWYEKGKLLHRLGKVEEALESFEKVISIDPENTDGWYNRGICLTKLGRNEESLEAFQEAKRLNSENIDESGLNGIDFLGILGGDRQALETLQVPAEGEEEGFYTSKGFRYRVGLKFTWNDGVEDPLWVKEQPSGSITVNSPRYAQCSLAIEANERIPCDYPAKELAADLAAELAAEEDEVRFYVFPNGQVPAYSVRTPPKYARGVWCDIVVTDHFIYHLKRIIGFDKAIGRQFAEKVIASFEPF